MTHFPSITNDRPEVFISGAVHGNEVLGPNIAVYLLEYLVANYGKDKWVTYLIENRKLVVMPAANSEGYYRLKRTEKYNGIEYDPNRDFPYDNSPDNCLNTLAGRSLVRVIADHMFVIGITFHGGTSSISYPWGSYNHAIKDKSEEAPDDYSMKQVAEMLREVAGSYPSKYIVGPMTDTVYAVNGGLEDWAYAASWAKDIENNRIIDICNSEENKKSGSKIIINGDNVRFPLYLIETAHQKYTREKAWGNITGVDNFGTNNRGNGHVARNISTLSLANFWYGKRLLSQCTVHSICSCFAY